jgi:Rhodopirellula transposase DDE domain
VENDALAKLAEKLNSLLPHLDERSARLLLAAEARAIGYGGIKRVAEITGFGQATIKRGIAELADRPEPMHGRVRRAGGGRKSFSESNPDLVAALKALVDPITRGDPMSPLVWISKSLRHLASALKGQGHTVSHETVSSLLKEMGFSLQANFKTKEESSQHPDRDAQFQHINLRVLEFQDKGLPVISVDCKKKELIGDFKNAGREFERKGQRVKVNGHDFMDKELGKAIPYGVFDITRNEGWVNVGNDHDTSAFAVETIRRWWQGKGSTAYRGAKRLLICADGGGSNGTRVRLWKKELATFAAESGLTIDVCHLPPGTSKWNKIEHRLFSYITMNWRARPLTTHDLVVELIGATTNSKGLRVHAELDTGVYPTKIQVSDEEMDALPLNRDTFHGEWNYSLFPPSKRKRRK